MAQVFLGMSGGVDSSAAAVLLQAQGYAVSGLHLSLLSGLPLPADRLPDDGSDARAVASLLGLPFYDMDLSPEFRATVIDYFIREYEMGRTPNPCVFCNRWIKFGTMWDAAQKLGADYLATGHYAKIRQDPATGRHLLCRGADRSKDQSYFLCRLTQEQLSRTLFPLGDLEKPAVRRRLTA
jgi:tRNA-specific 2-thiouridylase